MNLKETICNNIRPLGEKPIIQKIIEKSKSRYFIYENNYIACHADDRAFVHYIDEHEIKIEWIYTKENLNPFDEDHYDRAEIHLINDDKEFLENLFFKNIEKVEEL